MIQRYHFIIFIVGCDHNFSLYFSASSTRLNSSNNTNYIHHPLTSRHDSYTFYTIKNNTNLVTKKKTHLAEKSSLINNDITKISQRIVEELETASSKDLSDAKYAKKILQLSDLHHTKQLFQEIKDVSPGTEQVIEKRAVIKALLLSTWLQRLYFIIRTAIMSLLGATVTFLYISVLWPNRCCFGNCHGHDYIYRWVNGNKII